jgi:hypothetical protein
MFIRIICNHDNICIHFFLKKKKNRLRLYRKLFSNCHPLYTWNVNSEVSLQIMLFGTYNIDKASFEHHIYDIYKTIKIFEIQDL